MNLFVFLPSITFEVHGLLFSIYSCARRFWNCGTANHADFYIITIIIFLHGLGRLTGSGIIQVLLPQSEKLLVAWKLFSSEKLR